MAWIAWDKTCSSPSCGGLGIGSLHASNLAMLVKWWWRFHTENNSLWKLIITSIHGLNGGVTGFDSLGSTSSSMSLSPWNKIMNLNKHLVHADINLQSVFTRKVGNGSLFSFWNDAWLGEQCLKNIFPRLYALEQFKECKVVDRCNMLYGSKSRIWDWRRGLRDGHEKNQLDGLLYLLRDFDPCDVEDSWVCSLNSNNTYTVSSMRKMIEGNLLPFQEDKIRWNRYLPIKVNILSWRLRLNRLPTRCNLDHRGIDLHTTRCPLCNEDLETSQHIFVDCLIAVDLWNHISRWWGMVNYSKTLLDLSTWVDSTSLNNIVELCFDVVLQTAFWVLWRYRNRVCFDLKPPRKDTLMDEIMVYSHSWICHRSRNLVPNWIEWTVDPISSCMNLL